MQPIIRRTLTITVTETWTISWQDGQETVWQVMQEATQPVDREPDELFPPINDDEERDDGTLDLDAIDLTADDV